MSLGDLHNNLEKLRAKLRSIKYSDPVDLKGLHEGEASSILPIIHYCLLSYSKVFAEYIVEQGFDIMSKNDFSFLESVFKLFRSKFNYRPVLKIGQFLAAGFAERKIMMLLDIIQIVKSKANELCRYQQAEERKSKSPMRSLEEESLKVQSPPRSSNKIYKDPEEILMDYSNILNKNKNSVERIEVEKDFEEAESLEQLRKIVAKVKEDNRALVSRVNEQEEVIRRMQKRFEADTAQHEARMHLLSSKVRMLEAAHQKEPAKSERKQEEGLLSKLGISSNHLSYKAYDKHSPDYL